MHNPDKVLPNGVMSPAAHKTYDKPTIRPLHDESVVYGPIQHRPQRTDSIHHHCQKAEK